MMEFDAFISYSSKDKPVADAACATLEAQGIRCWMAPRDIIPGAEYGGAIIDALDRCRVVVLIFSSHANDSPQIHREIERAVSRGVPIMPLRIEDTLPTESMAYFMESVHWLDAISPPLESHLQRLGASLKSLLQADSPQSAALDAPARTEAATGRLGDRSAPAALPIARVKSMSGGLAIAVVLMRLAASIGIALLACLGIICAAGAVDLGLKPEPQIGVILTLGGIALVSFIAAYFVYQFGLRRPLSVLQ